MKPEAASRSGEALAPQIERDQELLPRLRLASEGAQHPARYHRDAGLVNAAGRHALMRRLDHHRDTARLVGVGVLLTRQVEVLGLGEAEHFPGVVVAVVDCLGDICVGFGKLNSYGESM